MDLHGLNQIHLHWF